ncbi:glycoside hydrolase family 31 protein [Zasmidium cellare ATCC 36951]|uniref:Glycoside hydrolase family 31 protein n=1 Tax=Zasmidium cellare ATCC 36951 TaxID=1080233 RepID=A0A6A6C4H2_ZASCE|nr:glycoside hydrolase family 31 protein [Zasmidium cellare ATCC 36951]KAF2161915.1 glycoside hydrolase family 31 protein [Zasmidium cellare ATCC 36951]
MHWPKTFVTTAGWLAIAYAQVQESTDSTSGEAAEPDLYTKDLSSCPGYVATKPRETRSGFYADLELAGDACNIYGQDLPNLKLEVEYQTDTRLHVKILDTNNTVYQVPDDIFPRPGFGQWCSHGDSKLKFDFNADPFSFSVSRKDSGEVLFDTSGSKLVFESQYLYLKTKLPEDPHLYGLGEHSDSFMLNTTNYTRTIWTRDSYGVPQGENLYGAHPIYFDHRQGSGTHGVFLLNSNGMDIYIDNKGGQHLEYNIIGGVLDFYFVAGPSPKDVAVQYSEITQLPLMTPYWGLGYHQCKYGYRDVFQVAEVVANYSAADIPLETMWTDIDYMELRRIFTLDPERFPANLVTDLVNTIHSRDQHYLVMVDPAVWSAGSNPALERGIEYDAFLKESNGILYEGVVWPGPTVFPDWFHPNAGTYWNEMFRTFFDGVNGPDIDALWIDMNEPANFCNRPYPCNNPLGFAEEEGNPPDPPPVRDGPASPLPGFPASLQPNFASDDAADSAPSVKKRQWSHGGHGRGRGHWGNNGHQWGSGGWGQGGHGWQSDKKTGSGCEPGQCLGLPNREYILPPYMIQNGAGPTLAEGTADTDVFQYGGLVQYDTHNLYGSMMSTLSKNAMLARRPDVRPLVITRSTFAGAGKDVSHWLGDNVSGWLWYRISISQQLQFASLYQIPVVGSDVCGFGGNTTSTLCARWATLGSFSTFFRNHAEISSIYQEFYRWPIVASAARNGIRMRYLLLDYIYTAIYRQNTTGVPCLNPLFFNYPEDANTYPIDLQFFYGDGILVSPVTEENSTSVEYYLPDDIFYDFTTGTPIRGEGAYITAEVPYDEITVHYKGGHIFPQRVASANTTKALRTKGFNIVIAPGLDGTAEGSLYLDDGESLVQDAVSEIDFKYAEGKLRISGTFEYDAGVGIEVITLLGVEDGQQRDVEGAEYDAEGKKTTVRADVPLTGAREITVG